MQDGCRVQIGYKRRFQPERSIELEQTMKPFETKARDYYGEVVINKALMSKAGFGARAVPVYVGEWIVSQFMDGDTLTDSGRAEGGQEHFT